MSDLPQVDAGRSWWAGLAELKRTGADGLLDADAEGAYSWVAVIAAGPDEARAAIAAAAVESGFKCAGVEDLELIESLDQARDLDEELSEALASLSAGDTAAWGTLNAFLAEDAA